MTLFRKTRLKIVRRKIREAEALLERYDYMMSEGGDVDYNRVVEGMQETQKVLQDLAWQEVHLVQNKKDWRPGGNLQVPETEEDNVETKELIEKVKAIRDLRKAAQKFEEECLENGVNPRTVKMKMPDPREEDAKHLTAMMNQAEKNLENAKKLSDKEVEIDVREVNRLISELITMVYHINDPIITISEDLPSLEECTDEVNDAAFALKEAIEDWEPEAKTTLFDLEEAARKKMAEEDPTLQGDLVMLLHRLGDPGNYPVSLVEMADKAMDGEYENVEPVATALDRMVDDYKETLSSRQQFEMSERDCLVAMDRERGTTC